MKKMTKYEIECECGLTVAIKEAGPCPLCDRHLSPAGSSPATGSRSREAVEEPGAHDKPTPPLARSRTEERVKLQRLSDFLKLEAEGNYEASEVYKEHDDPDMVHYYQQRSAEFYAHGSFVDELLSETHDESEAGEDERCPDCNGQGQHAYMSPEGPDIDVCHLCEGSGSRRKRSGSGNGRAVAPSGPEVSEERTKKERNNELPTR